MNSPDVQVRLATAADVDVLTDLNAEVQAVHVAARPDYFKATDDRAVSKWLAGMLDDPSITVWLAHLSEEAVGYVLVMIKERPENPFCHSRTTCEIDQIAVRARVRGTGVGRALMERAIAHAASHGIAHIELGVWAFNNAASAAFQRFGFAPRTLTLELVKNR